MKEENARIDYTAGFELSKGAKLDHGEVEVVVSNSGLDRHGEKILVEGIDLKEIKRNPVVLWGHDHHGLPIGKITKIWKSAGNLLARIKLSIDAYEFANTIYKLILDGALNAVSIGGLVREWDDDYEIVKKLEMLELSVVSVGAHPDALVIGKQLTKQYKHFVEQQMQEENLDSQKIKEYVKLLVEELIKDFQEPKTPEVTEVKSKVIKVILK